MPTGCDSNQLCDTMLYQNSHPIELGLAEALISKNYSEWKTSSTSAKHENQKHKSKQFKPFMVF